MIRQLAIGLLLGAGALIARAQELPTPPDLPPTPLARQALDSDPTVAAARAALESARTEARILTVGPYEFSTRITGQSRTLRDGPSYGEWLVYMERPVRLPGKAALDRRIGEEAVAEAQARYGDALHQASRELLRLWLDWLGTVGTRDLLVAQRQGAEENLRAVEKRFRAGDAAQLDVNLARAELEDLRRAESEASTQAAAALVLLQARFPGIQPAPVPLSEPVPLREGVAFWRERILAHSHELRIPAAQLARAQALAARARAERLPDPTLGVHAASEFGGAERIVGASVSIPIPGSRRGLEAARAASLAQSARQNLAAQTRMVEADVAATVAHARGNYDSARAAEAAAAATQANARLMQRAYALGEASLQDLILARRQAQAASMAAHQARLNALRARYRLLVDAHMIWDMEAQDHDGD